MSNEIEKSETKVSVKQTVSTMFNSPAIRGRVDEMLGKRAPQFISTVISMSNLPQLKDCKPSTIIGAAITAATMNLPVNQNLGYAYIVPYNKYDKTTRKSVKEAQFQMGYKGFIQLALRTGQYVTINDCKIPRGVLKSFNALTGELELDWGLEVDGEPDGYACYFELVNGFKKTIFWPNEKVMKHAKRYSKSFAKYNSGIWADDYEAMALKTVIKATLGKYGIMSIEMETAMSNDQAVIDADDNSVEFSDNTEDCEIEFSSSSMSDMKPAEEVEVEEKTDEDD